MPLSAARCPFRTRPAGFSLVELVIVIVILGIVAAIAVPRMSRGATGARLSVHQANQAEIQRAVDRYMAEHLGRTPAHGPDGEIDTDSAAFVQRLMLPTDDRGDTKGDAWLGPYLRTLPPNPFTSCQAVRIDGGAAPQACAWWFTTARALVRGDEADAEANDIFHPHSGAATPADAGDAIAQPKFGQGGAAQSGGNVAIEK